MLAFNLFAAQRLAEERMKDAMREAEQARLIRAARGPRKSRRVGVQLGRLTMIWLPLPGWLRVSFLAGGSHAIAISGRREWVRRR